MDQHHEQTNATPNDDVAISAGDSAGIVFWCLIGLSLVGMLPCLVLPAWREYQDATVTEQVRAHQMQDAQRELDIMRKRLDAIHNDPVVIARLARRELGFQTPDEQVLHIDELDAPYPHLNESEMAASGAFDGPPIDAVTVAHEQPVAAQLPAPLARISSMLPRLDYDRIFCKSPARELILLLSISLFIAAFVIFWPKPNADSDQSAAA